MDDVVCALTAARITRLIDVRHSPCASSNRRGERYGPKPWNLQSGSDGIAAQLAQAEIAYEWAAELGNPQRRDPAMTILRAHLADPKGDWPIHRGLARLAARVREPSQAVAILCACADPTACHRTVIAHVLSDRYFNGTLRILELGPERPAPKRTRRNSQR
jgi:hypothetical protein